MDSPTRKEATASTISRLTRPPSHWPMFAKTAMSISRPRQEIPKKTVPVIRAQLCPERLAKAIQVHRPTPMTAPTALEARLEELFVTCCPLLIAWSILSSTWCANRNESTTLTTASPAPVSIRT